MGDVAVGSASLVVPTSRFPEGAMLDTSRQTASTFSVDQYLPYLLARASQLISGEFHDRLRAFGVPVIQWRVMASLWERRAMSVTELARVVLLQQPTCSRVVGRMQRAGLVERTLDANDRRSIRVALSDHGRAVARPLVQAAAEHEARVRAPLPAGHERVLIEVLQHLVRDHAPPG